MSSDHDVIELLRTEAAPPMHVDLAEVVSQGRRRTRRRTAVAVAACAAAVAVIAVGSSLLSSPGNGSTTPAGTSRTSPGGAVRSPGLTTTAPAGRDPGVSGRHALTVGDAAYTLTAGDGLLRIEVVRGGRSERSVAGLLGSGGAWRVVDGTNGRQVVAGIVPGVAGAIELLPVPGGKVAKHTVTLSPGRDFTAFVVTFAAPLDALTPAADIGWSASGPATSWILGTDPQMAMLAVTMTGEGAAPLPPYDFTRTGPPIGGPPTSVVISISMPDSRIGSTAVATLQGDLVVKDPSRMVATLTGRDPETSMARGRFQLTDGRTFAWGVAPVGATDAKPHLDGGAKAGKSVLAPMLSSWTAYAVQVQGSAEQVSGTDISLGGERGGFGVIE